MEFGPRALGGRSIIGDARSAKMQETMNLKIKFRESFRPFAPSVLRERVQDWFELNEESPYMLLVAPVAKKHTRELTAEENKKFGLEKLLTLRSTIPAVTHVDYSARVQTVTEDWNPLYYRTIKCFEEKHGCPVVYLTGTVGGLMTSLHVPIKDDKGTPLKDGTFEKTERYGRAIGKLADRALANAKPLELATCGSLA